MQPMIVVGCDHLGNILGNRIERLVREDHFLRLEEIEAVFDWCVIEGLVEALEILVYGHFPTRPSSELVRNHFEHDTYRMFYNDVRMDILPLIQNLIKGNGLEFLRSKQVKVLVTRNYLILTFYSGERN